MNTAYEQAVQALSEAIGAKIDIGPDRVAMVTVKDRMVLLLPSDEAESGMTAFSVVARGTKDKPLAQTALEKALELNFLGAGTGGGHLGLFKTALVFSLSQSLADATAESVAEQLVVFTQLADDVETALGKGLSFKDRDDLLEEIYRTPLDHIILG